MAIDQVAELLVRWRQAGGVLGRRRVLSEGIRLLGGLDGEERRLLARSLAEQGAPELAGRLEHRTGGALSADQLWSVTDGLLALEDAQVEHLATSLRDPAERRRLARQAVAHGVTALDGSATTGSDHRDRLDELPPPGAIVDRDPGDRDPGDQDLGSQELGSQELGSQELEHPGLVEVDVHEVGLDPGPATATGTDVPPPEPRASGEAIEPADGGPAAAAADDTGPPVGLPLSVADPHSSPAAPPPAASVPAAPHAGDEPRGPVHPTDHDELLERLRDAATATGRLGLLRTADLGDLGPATALAVLDALPDGWQRRRAAERLVEVGVLPTDQLQAVLGRFDRPTDAAFVAGALVAAGQVHPGRFSGILPERVVGRLVARSER